MFLISSKFWEIRDTEKRGRGVYVKEDIEPGIVIGDYLGTIIPVEKENEYEEKYGFYGMFYNDKITIFTDKNETGINLINHSCAPNCAFFPYHGHTLFFALRKIFKNEELTVCYLADPPINEETSHNDTCYCETPVCRGTLFISLEVSKKWEEFVAKTDPNAPEMPGDFYSKLKPLDSYPINVPDNFVYDIFGAESKPPLEQNDLELPDSKTIRNLIRLMGRQLYYPSININVYGFMNGLLVAKTKESKPEHVEFSSSN